MRLGELRTQIDRVHSMNDFSIETMFWESSGVQCTPRTCKKVTRMRIKVMRRKDAASPTIREQRGSVINRRWRYGIKSHALRKGD